jgi:acetyl-CoA acyltransferase
MHDAVIVSATRTAVGRAPHGALKTVRPDEMAATVIAEALRRAPGVKPSDVEDVILGCAMPEVTSTSPARKPRGVPVSASAVTINRFVVRSARTPATHHVRIRQHDRRRRHRIHEHGADGGNKISQTLPWSTTTRMYLSTGLVAETTRARARSRARSRMPRPPQPPSRRCRDRRG